MSWIVRTGGEGATVADGTADGYIGTDSQYLKTAGNDYVSMRLLGAITEIIHRVASAQ